MSFGVSSEEPHAYVAYVDGEKEVVPLSFFKKFCADRRKEGWDRKYLYQVFWSPKSDDSPREALRRMPEIPVCEIGTTSSNRAGYYRATVLLVADSYEEVTASLERKRCPAGNMVGTYTSFDEPRRLKQSKNEIGMNNTSDQKPKTKKVKKPAGINQVAQITNASDITDCLKRTFASVLNETADEIDEPSECDSNSKSDTSRMKSHGNNEKNTCKDKEKNSQNAAVHKEASTNKKSHGNNEKNTCKDKEKNSQNAAVHKEASTNKKSNEGTRNIKMKVQNVKDKSKRRKGEKIAKQTSDKLESIRECPPQNIREQSNSKSTASKGNSILQLSSDNEENNSEKSDKEQHSSHKPTADTVDMITNNSFETRGDSVDEMKEADNWFASLDEGGHTDTAEESEEENPRKECYMKDSETSSNPVKSGSSVKRKLPFAHSDETLGDEPSLRVLTIDSEICQSEGGKKKRLIRRISSLQNKTYADTTDSEFEVDGKKFTCDPDYTPRKTEELKALIKIKDATIKKLQGLNLRHQENIFKFEDKMSLLEKENLELKQQVESLQAKLKSVNQRKENVTVQHKEQIFVSSSKKNPYSDSHDKKTSTSQHKVNVPFQKPVLSPSSSPEGAGGLCEPVYSSASDDEAAEEKKVVHYLIFIDSDFWESE
ncbi:hypothetical protein ONE63_010375 [Megalurothrips usitatus]|uniref:Uncharacterized protein n=1 Tax=Megalurothrips usitatus TaxID=439358 RepID=A0AAV7XPC6_9NEOP|nr:hypothetical protein ONE63_010375 [Megalurothrips usitatus]